MNKFLAVIQKRFGAFMAAVVALTVSAQNALATGPMIDTTSIDLDTESLIAWVLVILAALAIVWAVRKMIKTTNRS